MKIFALLFALAFGLFGAEIDEFSTTMGYYREYDQALAVAKKENKPLMLVMVGDYCPWCRKFERKTLQREAVALKVNANFVSLVVDRNLDKDKYPARYYAKRIPTVYFINPSNEETLFESLGYVKKDEFMGTLDDALTSYKGEKK
ncbi:MAG: thioredoxin family protein [Sulfurimonas sp.]|nr:thioredoxin family protein [Sulfurimonas sp.]